MKNFLTTMLVLVSAALNLVAAMQPPEKLLPEDTLVVLSAPDWVRLRDYHLHSPQTKFWTDPAMKPFLDKLFAKFNKEMVEPLEKELGIRFADFSGLAQGQVVFAISAGGGKAVGPGDKSEDTAMFLLVDSRQNSDQLKKVLADVKKKWVDANKEIKTDKIRDVEFSTFIFKSSDVKGLFEKVVPDKEAKGGGEKKAGGKPSEVSIGQVDSLLIIGNNQVEIEKLLMRHSGGSVAALVDNPEFTAAYNVSLRQSLMYGWVNLRYFIDALSEQMEKQPGGQPQNMFAPDPKVLIEALGIKGLKSISFSLVEDKEGGAAEFFLAAPAAERKGLLKMFEAEVKEALPPAFVPGDATKCVRYRLDLQNTWKTLENALMDINPALAGLLRTFTMSSKDPNFDFVKSIIGNLGDDIIIYQKKPRSSSLEDLESPPTLFLVGSTSAEQLAAAICQLPTVKGPSGDGLTERELMGRKVYSTKMGGQPPARRGRQTGESPKEIKPARNLSFCASGGYVVFSMDVALLEEHLRNSDNPPKSLTEKLGLAQTAQKVGGTATGLFGCENQNESMRATFETLKKNGAAIAEQVSASVVGARMGMQQDNKVFSQWFDFGLLPEYDQVAKYFGLSVYSVNAIPEGMLFKAFSPNPVELKKE